MAIGCAVALQRGTPRPAVVTAATVWGTLVTNYAIKRVVRRSRPAGEHLPAALIAAPASTSFPSSHAAMAAAAAMVLPPIVAPAAARDGGEPCVPRRPLPVRRGSRRAGRRRLRRGRRYTRRPMTMIHIPAREGRGFRVAAGQEFRVIDPEGEQVADLFCFVADDPAEFLSAEHTRVTLGRLWPHIGESFTTNLRRPILTWVADDSPGVHDMLCAACSPSRYQLLGAEGHHASCEENLQIAMSEFGHEDIEIPQPVNIFEANPILPNGDIGDRDRSDEGRRLGHAAGRARHDRGRHGVPAGPDAALRRHADLDRYRAALAVRARSRRAGSAVRRARGRGCARSAPARRREWSRC